MIESVDIPMPRCQSACSKKAYKRQVTGLLGVPRARPSNRRTAKQGDEFAPPHNQPHNEGRILAHRPKELCDDVPCHGRPDRVNERNRSRGRVLRARSRLGLM